MTPLGNPRAHFLLTLGMAKAVGADLSLALRDKKITQSEYSTLINRCRGCDNVRLCSQTLASPDGPLDGVPDYCANRDLLTALAA